MKRLLVGLALGVCACSASTEEGSRGSSLDGDGLPIAGAAGSAGSGGTAGRFGNPMQLPGTGGAAGSLAADAGPLCEVGKFCMPIEPDPDNCGTLRLESNVEVTRVPGNLLVVFDQSGSMQDPFGTTTKLIAARDALVAALTPLADSLTVGAIFFPTVACIPGLPPGMGGAVAPIDAAGQIPFQPGPQFLSSWQAHWGMAGAGNGIGTPMNEAFDRADVALKGATLTGNTVVVAFTDGAPNCLPDPALTGVPTMTEPTRAADWLATLGVRTFMVGLPGANGVQILNDVAMSGGTMQYILPDDPKALEDKLREVVQETVEMGFDSCSIQLTPAADVPDELLMIVEEPGIGVQQVARSSGWSLSADGANVEITGALCDDAMAGRFSSITFEYACPTAEPPPVLPPPE
jgi:hypothetical protein